MLLKPPRWGRNKGYDYRFQVNRVTILEKKRSMKTLRWIDIVRAPCGSSQYPVQLLNLFPQLQPMTTPARDDKRRHGRLNHCRLQLFLSGSSKFHQPLAEQTSRHDFTSWETYRWNTVKQSRVKWKRINRRKYNLPEQRATVLLKKINELILIQKYKRQRRASDLRPRDITWAAAGVHQRSYFIPADTHRNQATVGN